MKKKALHLLIGTIIGVLLFTGIPSSAIVIGDPLNRDWEALLHQVDLYVIYNHRCGFFGAVDALWTHQQNDGYPNGLPGDEFWQVNAFVGYRFARRQAEARLGILNLTDQDYRLNPLNLMSELPRERTLVASFKFMF